MLIGAQVKATPLAQGEAVTWAGGAQVARVRTNTLCGAPSTRVELTAQGKPVRLGVRTSHANAHGYIVSVAAATSPQNCIHLASSPLPSLALETSLSLYLASLRVFYCHHFHLAAHVEAATAETAAAAATERRNSAALHQKPAIRVKG